MFAPARVFGRIRYILSDELIHLITNSYLFSKDDIANDSLHCGIWRNISKSTLNSD